MFTFLFSLFLCSSARVFTGRPLKGFSSLLPTQSDSNFIPCDTSFWSISLHISRQFIFIHLDLMSLIFPPSSTLIYLSTRLFPHLSIPSHFLPFLLPSITHPSIASIFCQVFCTLLFPLFFIMLIMRTGCWVTVFYQTSYVGDVFPPILCSLSTCHLLRQSLSDHPPLTSSLSPALLVFMRFLTFLLR